MSEPATVAKISPLPKLEPGQAFIKGKIASRTKLGKSFVHVVSAPAADEYSFPKAYEISSKQPLGEVDEPVQVIVELTGRRAQKSFTDPNTGEMKKFPGAYVGLRAIED